MNSEIQSDNAPKSINDIFVKMLSTVNDSQFDIKCDLILLSLLRFMSSGKTLLVTAMENVANTWLNK